MSKLKILAKLLSGSGVEDTIPFNRALAQKGSCQCYDNDTFHHRENPHHLQNRHHHQKGCWRVVAVVGYNLVTREVSW